MTLPTVTTSGINQTDVYAVDSGFEGFSVQTIGVAASGGHYELMGSIDNGTTFVNITQSLFDLGTGALVGVANLDTDSIFQMRSPFPGKVCLQCSTNTSSTVGAAVLTYQDSRAD